MAEAYSVKFESNQELPLRDGTKTYVDVFRPDAVGTFPGLLQRTPYDKGSSSSRSGTLDAVSAASRGYAVAIQDVRGRYSSGGEFYTFVNESNDGYDSVEWLASPTLVHRQGGHVRRLLRRGYTVAGGKVQAALP